MNQDSRVVRKKSPRMEDEVVHTNKFDDSEESEEIQAPEDFTPLQFMTKRVFNCID